MGKNGSGKSTLAKVLVGHPDYEVTNGTAIFKVNYYKFPFYSIIKIQI